MARRRHERGYQIDLCAVNLGKMRALSDTALMRIWVKLGGGRQPRDAGTRLVHAYAVNLAAAKLAARVHRGKLRKDTIAVYSRHILPKLKNAIHALQEARCVTPEGRTIHRYRRTA
jgi:hypothetical protein